MILIHLEHKISYLLLFTLEKAMIKLVILSIALFLNKLELSSFVSDLNMDFPKSLGHSFMRDD